jgi:hypothetical protein
MRGTASVLPSRDADIVSTPRSQHAPHPRGGRRRGGAPSRRDPVRITRRDLAAGPPQPSRAIRRSMLSAAQTGWTAVLSVGSRNRGDLTRRSPGATRRSGRGCPTPRSRHTRHRAICRRERACACRSGRAQAPERPRLPRGCRLNAEELDYRGRLGGQGWGVSRGDSMSDMSLRERASRRPMGAARSSCDFLPALLTGHR